jgi:hypothetical protein
MNYKKILLLMSFLGIQKLYSMQEIESPRKSLKRRCEKYNEILKAQEAMVEKQRKMVSSLANRWERVHYFIAEKRAFTLPCFH